MLKNVCRTGSGSPIFGSYAYTGRFTLAFQLWEVADDEKRRSNVGLSMAAILGKAYAIIMYAKFVA